MYVSRTREHMRAAGRRSPVLPVVPAVLTPAVRGARVMPRAEAPEAEAMGSLVRPYLYTCAEWRRAPLAARLERAWWG